MSNLKQGFRRTIWAIVGVMLLGGSLSLRSEGQVSAARLSGTIADPSGAAVAGAQVEITNVQTSIARNLTTNGSGLYSAPSLPPGNYTIKVSSQGFSTEVKTGITLDVGSDQLLNITLKVGSQTENVAVNEIALGVDLTTSTLNDVVDGKNVRELPLNGRSWTDLAALTTGVTVIQTQPPVSASDRPKRGLGGQLSISGGRPQQNSYLLDGININDYSNAGPGSVLGGNLGVDAIQEFTVITTNPVAQYGRTSGGVISAITRSGTNELHGSAYEFVRDASLDAKNYFDQSGPKPAFRRNQYGGSLGGPIRKNSTFIFGDYEGIRQNLSQTTFANTPTAVARTGLLWVMDPVTGQLKQQQFTADPAVARFIQAFYPLPNPKQPASMVNSDLYSFVGTQVTTENFFTIKADRTFSPKDNAAVTYMYDNNPSIQNDELNNKNILSKTRRQLVSILETHIINASTLNSAHIGFSRDNAGSPYASSAINPAAADTSFGFVPGDSAGQVQVPGLTTFSGGLSSANPLLFRWNSWQAYDDISHTIGIHSLTFGANVERIQDNQFSADTPGGFYQFETLTKFITNQPLNLLATIPGTITNRNLRQTIYGAYFEDDVRFRPYLTVNLAMRYEGATIPSEINGKLSNLRVLQGNTPHLGNPYLANPTHRNFEPRVGFAWDPFRDGKTSVRAGFGIYDILPLIVEMGSGVDASYPFAQNVSGANLPVGSFPTQAYQVIANNPSDHRLYVIQYNPPRNYVLQWNLNVQRELLPGTTGMLAYVGSRGIHMWYQTDDGNIVLPIAHTKQGYLWPVIDPLNPLPPIDPTAGRVQVANWHSDSYFHALEAQLSQKVTHNLQGQLSYTFSRCIDTSSGSAASDQYRNSLAANLYIDPRTHRGLCDTNVSQNLVINTVWDIPHPANASGILAAVTSGWQLSGIFHAATGQPFSVTIGGDPLGLNSAVPFDFPDRITTGSCSTPTTGKQVAYIKAMQCFVFPALVNGHPRMGNAGRNELIGPGLVNMDFSLFKSFPIPRISDGANLQFRVETYNLFNHPDFAPPNANNTLFDGSGTPVPNAGFIDQTVLSSRQIQLALKFTF